MTLAAAQTHLRPGRGTPVVAPAVRVVGYTGPVAAYGDPLWPLDPLVANPSAPRKRIDWTSFPPRTREELRLVAWTMINKPLPSAFLVGRPAWHSRVSAPMLYAAVMEWRHFAIWMEATGTSTLDNCPEATLAAYARHLATRPGIGRESLAMKLGCLTRLWAFDTISPAPLGIAMPPWARDGVDDYLPAQTSRGENSTEPINPATMGPLLIWALRMVDDFSADVHAAWQETHRITERAERTACTPESKASLKRYLTQRMARGEPIPSRVMFGQRLICARYVAAASGSSPRQVNALASTQQWEDLAAYVRDHPGHCPLGTPIAGRIEGQPWTTAIDYTQTRDLMRHLGTACFIVIAYLTGMRPGEVLGLTAGCCPAPASGRHLIHGRVFKHASDEDGNHHSAGQMRDVPWVAIPPVVSAIRVLETLVPDGGLLFDSAVHTFQRTRVATATSLGYEGLRSRIESFARWASGLALRLGRPHETVPADPHGALGLSRFRRTLAWHIARRPGGLVALAIQYGHLRTAVSAGYASRSRDGIHDLLDIETARATADTLTTLHANLQAGESISGPAARRAIRAAGQAPAFAGAIRTRRQARDILDNPKLAVYDNPHAFVMCVYDRDRALCHRLDTTHSPSLDRCRPSCTNIARTDDHAMQLARRAAALEDQADTEAAPGPLTDRLRHHAARLKSAAAEHERTRITAHQETGS
ncbi:integrase [Streptomyces sp. NPDC047726]|uniref:integrase n=1 Tax=unclassified Streptomyces TaxID=2593676 RepID=UPI003403788C